jgi:glucose/arabinose dehydrogenase
MHRRRFLCIAGLAVSGLAGCSTTDDSDATEPGRDGASADTGANSDSPDSGTDSDWLASVPEAIGLESLASGLSGPVDVVFAEDRTYIAEQRGTIRVYEDGSVRSQPLLDLRGRIETGGEKGLLGIATHPQDNRRLFVRYSSPARPGTPSTYSHTFVLAEFRVTETGRSVQPASERTVMEIPQPQANHNAGDIVFGPDDALYVAVGDGGAGGDRGTGHVSDWYDTVEGGNGQDVTENLLGSVLRIDVDSDPDRPPRRGGAGEYNPDAGYAVPADNPLVDKAGLDEQYAWGLRNPWRMAFDSGNLYAGDVGQSEFEEINHIEAGGNYGWNVMEGAHCYAAEECPDSLPAEIRDGERLREPVVEYPHADAPVSGISVIGGTVYRGRAVPGLEGLYVFGDFRAEDTLFLANPVDERPWPTTPISVSDRDAGALQRIRSFGRRDGEVYVVGIGDDGGALYRLVPPAA